APDGYQLVVGNVGTHAQNQFLSAYPPAISALADQASQTKLHALGAEPAAPDRNTQDQLQAFLAAEREKWGTVIRKANIRLELHSRSNGDCPAVPSLLRSAVDTRGTPWPVSGANWRRFWPHTLLA